MGMSPPRLGLRARTRERALRRTYWRRARRRRGRSRGRRGSPRAARAVAAGRRAPPPPRSRPRAAPSTAARRRASERRRRGARLRRRRRAAAALLRVARHQPRHRRHPLVAHVHAVEPPPPPPRRRRRRRRRARGAADLNEVVDAERGIGAVSYTLRSTPPPPAPTPPRRRRQTPPRMVRTVGRGVGGDEGRARALGGGVGDGAHVAVAIGGSGMGGGAADPVVLPPRGGGSRRPPPPPWSPRPPGAWPCPLGWRRRSDRLEGERLAAGEHVVEPRRTRRDGDADDRGTLPHRVVARQDRRRWGLVDHALVLGRADARHAVGADDAVGAVVVLGIMDVLHHPAEAHQHVVGQRVCAHLVERRERGVPAGGEALLHPVGKRDAVAGAQRGGGGGGGGDGGGGRRPCAQNPLAGTAARPTRARWTRDVGRHKSRSIESMSGSRRSLFRRANAVSRRRGARVRSYE